MEGLLVGGYNPDKMNEAAVVEIRNQLAVLNYLAETIKENAPDRYRSDATYEKLEKGLFASLDGLYNALESNDPKGVSKAIKMLKPAYAKLFVNFG